MESNVKVWRRILATRMSELEATMDAYKDATGFPPISIGGTHEIRMAIRLDAGRTLDECVAKEIIYRVGLAWQSPVLWPLPAGWMAGTEAGEGM